MRIFDYEKFTDRKWDTEILNLTAKIHEYKGRQDLFLKQKPVELNRLVEIAKIQSTEFSNKIEGIIKTGTRLKQLFQEKTTPKNRDESEIMGYRDVLNLIHENHDYIPIKASYILQLHKNLMKKAGFRFAGNFKNVQNYIVGRNSDGTMKIRFTPIPPHETPEAIEAICQAYEKVKASEKVDMLLVIPAFICDFLCIHPFNDGNGRISRLLTLLLLYQNGFEVGKYISIEKQIEKSKDLYYNALEISDENWHDGNNDVTPFMRYMLQIILACYVEFEERINLNRHSAYDTVRKYVEHTIGKFTSSEVIMNCPSAGRSSVLNALKILIQEGLIVRHGSGKSVYYVKADADEWFKMN